VMRRTLSTLSVKVLVSRLTEAMPSSGVVTPRSCAPSGF
jgi:hypothetical protein